MQSQEEGAGKVRRGHGAKEAWPGHGGSAGGSTFAIDVEELKRRPPSVGGRPRP